MQCIVYYIYKTSEKLGKFNTPYGPPKIKIRNLLLLYGLFSINIGLKRVREFIFKNNSRVNIHACI